MKKIVLFGSLVLITNVIFAANNSNLPASCVKDNFQFNQDSIILNNKAANVPQIFLLHNNSAKNFTLDHPIAHPAASAGWASVLNANQWSALFVDKKSFTLTCSHSESGKLQKLPCKQLLQVCELEEAKISPTLDGTFWLAENQSLPDLLKAIEKRGIALN